MPLLVVIGGWLSAVTILLSLVGFIVGSLGLLGQSKASTTEVSAWNWYYFAAINAVLGAIVIGLVKRKSWSRPLMVLFWVLVLISEVVAFPGHRLGAREIGCTGVIGLLCAAAYLYLKRNVDQYFESLKSQGARPDTNVRPA